MRSLAKLTLAAAMALAAIGPGAAQIRTIDPNQAGEYGDGAAADPYSPAEEAPAPDGAGYDWGPAETDPYAAPPPASAYDPQAAAPEHGTTVPSDDVFTAAEDLFGRGAEGLAGMLEDVLRKQGEPAAYIAGREAGGSFVFGVRYGSGVLRHRIEGERPIYWTGPSLGFDFGANADKVFVLVYNLHDTQELFERFPGAEGSVHVVGGFTAQYLRRGDIVLIPIRMGVGLRLGVNAGYMRFSEKNRWLPF